MAHRRRTDGERNWIIDFRVGGKRFRHTRSGTLAKRDIAAMERRLRQEVEEGVTAKRERRAATFGELAGRYWHEHARHLKWSSNVASHLTRWSDALGDDTPARAITGSEVATVVSTWRAEVGPATINRRLACLRGIWNRATTLWNVPLTAIPWAKLALPEPEPEDRSLSTEQCRRLIAAAPRHVAFAFRLALLTGLRPVAIKALDWSHVDWERARIYAVGKGRGKGKPNPVAITPAVAALLDEIGRQDIGPIITWRGRPVRSWRTAWARTKARAGLPDADFYSARHTFAQALEDAGHGDTITDMLHHSTPVLRRRYAKANLDRLARVLTKVQGNGH